MIDTATKRGLQVAVVRYKQIKFLNMDIVKKIINCETNTKFIRVHDNGFIDIPDVIFYVLYESGDTDVVGCCLGDVYPQIAGEVDNEDSRLLGFLEGECDDALGSVKAFVKEIKKLLPYLRIDKSVDEWMKEH